MRDVDKTKAQLVEELAAVQQHAAALEARLRSMEAMEVECKRAEAVLQLFVDAIPDTAFLIDTEGTILVANSVLAHGFGKQAGELLGRDVFDFLPPDVAATRRARLNQVIQTKQQMHFEDEREGRFFLNYICPVLDAAGCVSQAAIFAIDITERKYMEMRLQESEARYKAIVDMAPEGIVTASLSGMVLTCNPAFSRLSGFSEEQIVGKHLSQLPTINLKDLPWYLKTLAAIAQHGVDAPVEFPWMHKDGERRWGEARISFIKEEGKAIGLQAIVIDITERKRVEDLLQALNQASLAMARALTPQEIFDAIAAQLDALGFACGIMLYDEAQQVIRPKYLSYHLKVLRAAERMAGLRAEEVCIPIDTAEEYDRVIRRRETVFVKHAEDFMRQVLPRSLRRLTGQIRRVLNVPRFILAPLIVTDRVIGILTVQADSLLESDAGAITAFAHQVAGAWQKANLLEVTRQSEERFRVAFHTSPDAVNINRLRDGLYVDINEGFTALTGYTRADVIGRTSLEINIWANPEDRARLVAGLREHGSVNNMEAGFRYKNGLVRMGLMSARILSLEGEPHILSITRDISERIEAQAELARLQNLLQNITDSMPSALITLDVSGRVLTWNPEAEQMTGYEVHQVVGRPVWEACPLLARYRDLVAQVLEQDHALQRHKDILVAEGGTLYRDVSVFPLIANGIDGVVLRIDDVTRRVQMEQMMLQSAKMASIGGLAAGVAHEINNPLGAMMQSAQMLQIAFNTHLPRTRRMLETDGIDPGALERYLDQREVHTYLSGIRETGARAAKIVSDLLSFSRQSQADAAFHDLNALLKQALELATADYDLKRRYDFRDVEVVWELTVGLPKVLCDGQQVQQVVLNLVRNAAYAMAERPDGSRGRLTLRTALGDEGVRFEVEDNGPGIPKAMRERLFEPFFTTKEVGSGTGLGLWLCWSIVVDRHGGRIWVEDGQAGGACFVVELPIGNVEEGDVDETRSRSGR
ncbi:MAG: PAS domain S-box protein [Anaerolineae bacterium]|nr:PAS domain S-box protein [Anaerolineae bacterium]